jgi:hypothetical protein
MTKNYSDGLFTMTGIPYNEFVELLDKQLDPSAYKKIPMGGADLTDIGPDHMREFLNQTLGICGWGWGYEYEAVVTEQYEVVRKRGKPEEYSEVEYESSVPKLTFWYKLTDGADVFTLAVSAPGGNKSTTKSYSMSGAVTNALGKAVSNIGFQRSVYLGKRSHSNLSKPEAVNENEYGIKALTAAIRSKEELGLSNITEEAVLRHLQELNVRHVATYAGYVASGKVLVAKLKKEQQEAITADGSNAPPGEAEHATEEHKSRTPPPAPSP